VRAYKQSFRARVRAILPGLRQLSPAPRVCAAPRLNGSCLKLKRSAEDRDDEAEEAVVGQRLDQLPQAKWPACAAERMGFMAPFEYVRMVDRPYNSGHDTRCCRRTFSTRC